MAVKQSTFENRPGRGCYLVSFHGGRYQGWHSATSVLKLPSFYIVHGHVTSRHAMPSSSCLVLSFSLGSLFRLVGPGVTATDALGNVAHAHEGSSPVQYPQPSRLPVGQAVAGAFHLEDQRRPRSFRARVCLGAHGGSRERERKTVPIVGMYVSCGGSFFDRGRQYASFQYIQKLSVKYKPLKSNTYSSERKYA